MKSNFYVCYLILENNYCVYVGHSGSFLSRLNKHLKYIECALNNKHVSSNRHKLYEFLKNKIESNIEIRVIAYSKIEVEIKKLEEAVTKYFALTTETLFNTTNKSGIFSKAHYKIIENFNSAKLISAIDLCVAKSLIGQKIWTDKQSCKNNAQYSEKINQIKLKSIQEYKSLIN